MPSSSWQGIMEPLHSIAVDGEPDLVHIRRVVRRLAQLLGYDRADEVRITTAVGEIARAVAGCSSGPVEIAFSVGGDRAPQLVVDVTASGFAETRGGTVTQGLVAAEKLLERLATKPGSLRFGKPLPENSAPTADRLAAIHAELQRVARPRFDVAQHELSQQSQDLATALLEAEDRKQELATLNAELRDTNRGVMALYAELDERADQLRQAAELKTRFFSYISHEFRTPLNSILALSNILLAESDGPLRTEQARQVSLIRDGVADLLDLVGDLLDTAKLEAGQTQVTVATLKVEDLFGALRTMIRPLLATPTVALDFACEDVLPPLLSDENKINQILRNFLSNAVKFTEQGGIVVSARMVEAGESMGGERVSSDSVLFAVADTGIGISAEHHATIFAEFQQVDNRLQRRSRGTGLGLPLCRRLAGLLGGRVWVESELGRGSTFYLLVPRVHRDAPAQDVGAADRRPRLIIVDELAERRAAVAALFRDSGFATMEVVAAEITPPRLTALQPTAAIVDLAHTPPTALDALRAAAVPVIAPPPGDALVANREQLLTATYRAVLRQSLPCVLVLDDNEAYRTILAKQLAPFCERVRVTSEAREVIAAATSGDVSCVVLDLIMPDVDGMVVLQQLRAMAAAAYLPVVICSSKSLSSDELAAMQRLRASFLPKDSLAPTPIAQALLEAQRLATSGPELAESAA
jgi:signal transduction histidine kinase/CheY-like chemotaxis protein